MESGRRVITEACEVYLMLPAEHRTRAQEQSPNVKALISGIQGIESTEEEKSGSRSGPMIQVTRFPQRQRERPVAEIKVTVDDVDENDQKVDKTTTIKFNLVDTGDKHAALHSPLPLRTRHILVFPLDNDDNAAPLEEQYAKFKEMVQNKPAWASRIICVLPDTARNKAFLKGEAKEHFSDEICEEDFVYGTQELFEQINKPSRKQLFSDYIETQVIADLIKEQQRLAKKYDLTFEESPNSYTVGRQTHTYQEKQYQKNGLRSKDMPGKGTPSKETEEHRINAIERCQAIERTINELRKQVTKTKANELNNLKIEKTLESFKKIVNRNIVEFDKRPGGWGWGSKFGRVVLNGLVGVLFFVGAPWALEAVKKKTVESMKTGESNFASKAGKKLGLTTDTGLWFRLGGKTSYEGKKALENLDIASKVIRETEREESKKFTPRKR